MSCKESSHSLDSALSQTGAGPVDEALAARVLALASAQAEDPVSKGFLSRVSIEELLHYLRHRPSVHQLTSLLKSLISLLQESNRPTGQEHVRSLKTVLESLSHERSPQGRCLSDILSAGPDNLPAQPKEEPHPSTSSFTVAKDLLTIVFPGCETPPAYLESLSQEQVRRSA